MTQWLALSLIGALMRIIAGKFRGARVPAFSGAPVHVKKSFSVN